MRRLNYTGRQRRRLLIERNAGMAIKSHKDSENLIDRR
jgi:hypothetical protein